MIYFWLGLSLILGFIEIISINLTTVWFVISGLLAMVISFFTDSILIQFAVFVLVGVILLATTRPLLKKLTNKVNVKTNADRIIGMHGIVTEEIKNNQTGEVKVDGKRWTATADKLIKVDSTVVVLEINGVKIKVEEVEK